MRILILDAYYDGFLNTFYKRYPETERVNYILQKKRLLNERFGCSDAYSFYLTRAGVEAEEVITNDVKLQVKWATEHGVNVFPTPALVSKVLNRLIHTDWRLKILAAQIKKLKPDILFIQERNILTDRFIAELKPHIRLIACQIASPIPVYRSFRGVDLVFTSLPNIKHWFEARGLPAHLLPLCFDPRCQAEIESHEKRYDFTFVGSISKQHDSRKQLLEGVARDLGLVWFGQNRLSMKLSPLKRCYRGEAWGLDMYKVLVQSKVSINCHIDIAQNYANNMRLFEVTGMGSCLVTDWKENLNTFFEPGREVIAYRTGEELVENLRYLKNHEAEREDVAKAGQRRTLRDHTYEKRIPELVSILKRYL